MTKRLLSCLLLATAAACGARGSGETVTFGAAGPWSDGYGDMNKKGMELAMDDVNAKWRDQGRQLRFEFRNDSADGVIATRIAQWFVDSSDAVAVVGHVTSGAMKAAARVYDGNIPAIATTASSPELTGISRWTFRTITSDSANGVDIAKFAERRGWRRAALIYENNSYGRGLVDAFRGAFSGEIVAMDPMAEGGDAIVEPLIAYLKRRAPDVIFVAGTEVSGLRFVREARRQGLTAQLMGGDGWSMLSLDTAAAEGVYVGVPFTAETRNADVRQWVQRFQQKFPGVTPDGNAALAYDATMLLAQAVAEVGADREKIRDYLAAIGEQDAYRGITGALRFSAGGDPVGKQIVMTRIRSGALVEEGSN